MKAKAFDEIWMIIDKEPLAQLDSEKLAKLFNKHKNLKVTNSILNEKRKEVRPDIVKNLQENLLTSLNSKQNHVSKKRKFLNQFYLFNGLPKYYEHVLKKEKSGHIQLPDSELKEIKNSYKIINSNLDGKEKELMKVFNCNPKWPICLYDFTFKNKCNQFLIMKCRSNLSKYVVNDYFEEKGGINKYARSFFTEDESDVIREQTTHICCNYRG